MLDRRGPVDPLEDHVRLVEGLLDRALADLAAIHLAFEMGIPVAPVVNLRRVLVEGATDVEQRRQLLEGEVDRVDRRHRGVLVLGRNHGDRLTLVAHLVLREQRLVRGDPECGEMPVLEQRYVLPRDHCLDAGHRLGLRNVEAGDRRAM